MSEALMSPRRKPEQEEGKDGTMCTFGSLT